ncbi:MAG: ParB/RepB/Spo0J family partition protein [Proteobacteria bacterium]|nr:ParB/RepB/Spo0J family partition protein [Pseudomonadota bacterium]
MAEEKRKNLGRGLSALMGEDSGGPTETDNAGGSRLVPVERLLPGRYQPRHSVDEEKISELAQSIRENGIIQPLLVRRHSEDKDSFEIIAGERRWRAAQMAKLHEVPVIIKDLNDQEALEIALVENLQRQDLSSLEEAEGYQRLMDEFSHTQEILAKTVGKSRSHIANTLRLLGLPGPVKKMLGSGDLSAGHARAILNAPDPVSVARQVVKKELNVRQTERLVRKKQRQNEKPKIPEKKDVDTVALERDLANLLGLKVGIKFKNGGGSLTVHYSSLEQLDDILRRLGKGGAAVSKTEPAAPLKTKASRKATPKITVGLKSKPRRAKRKAR